VNSTPERKELVWKNPSRVFLSAYIIVAHTSEIMPNMAAEEIVGLAFVIGCFKSRAKRNLL
jgi:hypothetical protein